MMGSILKVWSTNQLSRFPSHLPTRKSLSSPFSTMSSKRPNYREIALSTVATTEAGAYLFKGETFQLQEDVEFMKHNVAFYAADSTLSEWVTTPASAPSRETKTDISFQEISTLQGARLLASRHLAGSAEPLVGVLNFASAKNPGGGFLGGAQAQEESIARASTLYPSLMTSTAQQYYSSHKRDPKKGYYSHAMIYSPRVVLFRDDRGEWKTPVKVDILTSPAVNAGLVRRHLREVGTPDDESGIEAAMKERMARVLYLFEQRGVKELVLGSFGTGVFRNKVELVASTWADLLEVEGARFQHSFERVLFAVIGKDTPRVFREAYEVRLASSRVT